MTSDDAKEWVTVKLPKDIRDAARDDPRTYGEVMRAGLDAPNPENDADINRDLLAEQVVDTLSAELGRPDTVTLEASERRAIAEEVAEVLGR